jgi:GntR family transcriptional regulator
MLATMETSGAPWPYGGQLDRGEGPLYRQLAAATPRLRPSARLNSLADIVANTADARLAISGWRAERSRLAETTFGLPRGTACHCLRARLLTGDAPVAIVTIYFPPRIGGRLTRADFDDVVVFRSVQRRLGLSYTGGRVTVRAVAADSRAAAALGCTIGSALLIKEFVYFGARGEPVELTISQQRGDLYSLTYDLKVD